jgi:L-histidine N-alpha-methyltransferase
MRTAYRADRFEIIDCGNTAAQEEMKREVREGLTARQRFLPCKYFYDSRGSALFKQICRLPEYYQTRTELSILAKAAPLVMEGFKEGSLVELGSGSNWKIRCLLDAADGSRSKIRYMPVDVCQSALLGSTEELLSLYPDLTVSALVGDFHRHMDRLDQDGDKLITFFGSTIGNFSDEERSFFLRNVADVMDGRDRLLLGLDMVKSKEILEAAYNDDQGITAQFNKNILAVMNRELNASFSLSSFDHFAFYNEAAERIEMHLQATEDVDVDIEDIGLHVAMREKETIFTEISRKFRKETVEEMASDAGLMITRIFTDRQEWFSLVEMKKGGSKSSK